MRPLSLGNAATPQGGTVRRLAVIICLLTPLGLIAVGRGEDHSTWIGRAAAFCTQPIQVGITACGNTAALAWQHYVALYHVAIENDGLRASNARLMARLAALEEVSRENERLHRLLQMQSDVSLPASRGARVIAVSPMAAFRSLRIDRGKADGVGIGDAVVATAGLVGRIATVSEHTADVLLVVDATSSVDAVVQRSRARVRVRGEGGDATFGLDAQYLERTADVEPGDLLLTSGLGQTFPKGLFVGRIRGVERRAFGLYQRAIVQPSVDVSTLEEVLVTPSQSKAIYLATEAASEP